MKRTGQLIASAAIAVMATGTLGGSILAFSATEAAAKSAKGSEKSSEAGSKSKGKDNVHRGNARYLRNLNAMCSKGKSQSTSSNVYRINAFYDAQAAVADFADEKAAAETALDGYEDPNGVEFGDESFDLEASIAAETDAGLLAALTDYQTALALEAVEHEALVTVVRGENRLAELESTPEGQAALDAFMAGCGDS